MTKLLKYLRIFFLVAPRLVFEYFRFILPMSRHPERYDIVRRYNAVRALIVKVLSRLRLDIRTPEEFPHSRQNPHVYVCNHVGALDPLIFIAKSREPVTFVGKKEARKIPVVGRIIRILDGAFLDREDPFQAVRCFQTVKKKMAEGWSYCIFPEGTREKGEQLGHPLPFHPGSFKIGYMSKAPIVLSACFGSFHAFSSERGFRRNLVQISLAEVIPYEAYKDKKTVEVAAYAEEKLCLPILTLVQEDRSFTRAGLQKEKCPKWWKEITYLEEKE